MICADRQPLKGERQGFRAWYKQGSASGEQTHACDDLLNQVSRCYSIHLNSQSQNRDGLGDSRIDWKTVLDLLREGCSAIPR